MSQDDANRIVDWLERLSSQEGYVEARQFRRDIIDAMGEDGVSWEGLSDLILAEGLTVWLVRPRPGGMSLPPVPGPHLPNVVAGIKRALATHETEINRPATLSVEQFGDGLQALWAALRGPSGPDDAPSPSSAPGPGFKAQFKLNG